MRRFLLCVMVILAMGVFSGAGAATFNVSTEGEFQAALTQAEGNGEDDVINVDGDMNIAHTLTYRGEQGHTLTINGNGHSLDGGNSVQIMNISITGLSDDTGSDITIRDLTFQNGNNPSGSGGGIVAITNNANITLEGCTFKDNSAAHGGGISVTTISNGSVTLTTTPSLATMLPMRAAAQLLLQ